MTSLLANEERKELVGVRVSAWLLAAFGCLWALYSTLFGVFLCVSVIRTWRHSASPQSANALPESIAVVLAACVAMTWLCFKASSALFKSRQWAAYVATLFGLLLVLLSGSFVYDVYHPERQVPDEAFGMIIMPFALCIGLWWCIYLNLFHVRAHLRTYRSA